MLDFEGFFTNPSAKAKASISLSTKKKPPPKKPAPKKPAFAAKLAAPIRQVQAVIQRAPIKQALKTAPKPKPVSKKERARAKLKARFTAAATAKPSKQERRARLGLARPSKPATKPGHPFASALRTKLTKATRKLTPKALPKTPVKRFSLKALTKPRFRLATKIMTKAAKTVARKAPALPRTPMAILRAKAHEAVKPVAQACKCPHAPVLTGVESALNKCGYPAGAATALLAGVHDMTTRIEHAAKQRLATAEHQTLSAQQTFEHEVLTKLDELSKKLPRCHPTRTRAQLSILRGVT